MKSTGWGGTDVDGGLRDRHSIEFDGYFRDWRRESEFVFDGFAATGAVEMFLSWFLGYIQSCAAEFW